MRKIIVTFSALVFGLVANAQETGTIAKGTNAKEPKEVQKRPADFPKFVDTGNPEEDEKNYRAAKQKYMEEHYGTEKAKPVEDKSNHIENERTNNETQKKYSFDKDGRVIIQKSDFDQFSDKRKETILSQPEKFVIQ